MKIERNYLLEAITLARDYFGLEYDLFPMPSDTIARLEAHVKDHKYLLETQHALHIGKSSSYASWEEYVFGPILTAIRQEKLVKKLKMHPLQLYLEVSDHWHYLKESVPKEKRLISQREAAKSYKMLKK